MKIETRESWLQGAIEQMRPLFEQHGYKIPDLRVSTGWPVRGGLGKKKRVLGECWDKKASEDQTQPQIFISPWLSDAVTDPQGVLPVLVHEIVHAVVGHKEAHNKIFGKCARAVGLEGKLTHPMGGAELIENCKKWSDALGPYPHSKLDALKDPSKKQSTRLIKCVCECEDDEGEQCGYTVRTTNKWIAIGTPICPICNMPMTASAPPAEKEGEGDE